jgi:hypothetical protein
MSFRRYEITLPTRYNDGSTVEPEKYLITLREIAARFGALTFLPQPILGEWTHQQMRYEDTNIRIVVDVEDTLQNSEFFATLKETLKKRFHRLKSGLSPTKSESCS